MTGWEGSTRSARLPDDWPERRRQVLERDGYRCRIQLPGCTVEAEEADHIIANDDHRLENLQAACTWCNQQKNINERPLRTYHSTKRDTESHPGLR